jgi:creatinine amidohydrolase
LHGAYIHIVKLMKLFCAALYLCLLPGLPAAGLSPKWEELSAKEFVQAIEQSAGVCLLPFGILEKHGPHLPLGNDLINVRWAALHGAGQEYAVVFPEYYFGQIFEARSCNSSCFRRPPMKWRATAARRS